MVARKPNCCYKLTYTTHKGCQISTVACHTAYVKYMSRKPHISRKTCHPQLSAVKRVTIKLSLAWPQSIHVQSPNILKELNKSNSNDNSFTYESRDELVMVCLNTIIRY